MGTFFIASDDFIRFVEALLGATRVVAPVAKRNAFAYAELTSPEELRLDFDVTLLPPKKVFFPPTQDLVRFRGDAVSDCIAPVPTVLLGVHFYDVKAIDMTDLLFRERTEDWNYLAHREATTIVASNIERVAPRAFWDTCGADVRPQGHDAFLTRIDGGYVLETRTSKGDALLDHGAFREASAAEAEAARAANEAVWGTCPEKLDHPGEAVARKVREAFADEAMWDRLARHCFSCGSCNIVCPTCYCFDVRDSWDLDQVSGRRTRYWDACLTREFAVVTMASGGSENFREHRSARFRHRFMRKTAYLYERLGGPACVGCGRCSRACTADIADPVRVIDAIMEERT